MSETKRERYIRILSGLGGADISSEACKELVELLKEQPETAAQTAESAQNVSNEDLISRKAAIDAIYHHLPSVSRTRARTMLHEVPSAQPEPESISEWKKEFREYVGSLDIARDDWKGIIEYIDELPSAQPNLDEWCTDCKEYDHEKHCCPRFNRVIRDTLNEVEPMRKRGTWMHDKDDVLISGYCSCCGWESIIMETDVADMPFCPNCGADMRGGQE